MSHGYMVDDDALNEAGGRADIQEAKANQRHNVDIQWQLLYRDYDLFIPFRNVISTAVEEASSMQCSGSILGCNFFDASVRAR